MAGPIFLALGIPCEITRETMATLPIRRYEGEGVSVENHRMLVLWPAPVKAKPGYPIKALGDDGGAGKRARDPAS